MAKPNYEKPSALVDLEERQKKDYVPSTVRQYGTDPAQSETGYVATDPIYQNAANEYDLPKAGEGGAEAKIEKNFVSDDADYDFGRTPEGDTEEEEEGSVRSTPPPPGNLPS